MIIVSGGKTVIACLIAIPLADQAITDAQATLSTDTADAEAVQAALDARPNAQKELADAQKTYDDLIADEQQALNDAQAALDDIVIIIIFVSF